MSSAIEPANGYYAHSHKSQPSPGDKWQLLEKHLRGVADLSRRYAEAVMAGSSGFANVAWWAGMLHDIGKYRPEFQQMIRKLRSKGETTRHKQAGAAWAWDVKQSDIAVAIAGHHGGMPDAVDLKSLVNGPGGRDVANRIRPIVLRDFPELAASPPGLGDTRDALAFDLRVRLLFSCLVDADWSDTGAHDRWANGDPPLPEEQRLTQPHASALLGRVLDYIELRAMDSRKSHDQAQQKTPSITAERQIPAIRAEILEAALVAAAKSPGLFSMTVPTGGGKTLASLAFALEHARRHGLRRVIYVAPYLSILEQNAREIRRALCAERDSDDVDLVFEHHSLAEPPGGLDADEAESEALARQAQAWSAPFVVTTNVQFFESLFSNQPSQCRKLHNIARSVVILDECQTLPPGLIEPTCSMLNGLTGFAGASIVLCTATQPAWNKSSDLVNGLENVREIVSPELNMFERLRRVNVEWPTKSDAPLDWPDVAQIMNNEVAALCVVNTKKAAKVLFDAIRERTDASAFHLSTAMCPAHRLEVLDEVRRRLKANEPCHLVSTQLIEAGVDVDFPLVMRELAPLEAIVQAAGRCNREGLRNEPNGQPGGRVIVFRSVAGSLPHGDGWYPRGRDTLETAFLNGNREPDIASPSNMREYFQRLYATGSVDARGIEPLRQRQRFATIWHGDESDNRRGRYRLIEDNTFPAFVATWTPHVEVVQRLLDELARRPSPRLFRELGRFQVNFRHHEKFSLAGLLSTEAIGVEVWRGKYDEQLGIIRELDELDWIV